MSTKGGGSVLFIDDAFNVYLRSDAAGGPDYRVVTPLGRTPTGNPIWDWGQQRPGPNTPFNQTRSSGPTPRATSTRHPPTAATATTITGSGPRPSSMPPPSPRPAPMARCSGRPANGPAGADPSARADALPDQHARRRARLHRLRGLHREPRRVLDRRRTLRRRRLRPARSEGHIHTPTRGFK